VTLNLAFPMQQKWLWNYFEKIITLQNFNYLCEYACEETKHGDFETQTSIFVLRTIRTTRLPCPLTMINEVIKFFTCLLPRNLVTSLGKLISLIQVVLKLVIFLSLVNRYLPKRIVRQGKRTRTTANWLYTWLGLCRQFRRCLPFAMKHRQL
jgi:heme/copper-type cytochrome/quinol oxidase subunit 4